MPSAIMSRCQQPTCNEPASFEAIVPRGEGQPPANLGPLCAPCAQAARRKHAAIGMTLRLLAAAGPQSRAPKPTYGPDSGCTAPGCTQRATSITTTGPRRRYCEYHARDAKVMHGVELAPFEPQPVEQRQARERIPDLATVRAMATARARAVSPLATCGQWPCTRPAAAVYASTLDGQRERRCARHAADFEHALDGRERANYRKLDMAGERLAWLDD